MKKSLGRLALAAWLAILVASGIVVARTTFTADLSAFLPQSPTPEQRVLLDQLQDGVVSRLILAGLEGGDAALRAALSRDMARRLRGDAAFAAVKNGEPVDTEGDQAYLFGNRYLLSPGVTPDRFTAAGLHQALEDGIGMLASSAGMMMGSLFPRDPTGETLRLLEGMQGASRPAMHHGVWASRDGARTVLLLQTRAAGADIDGQQEAMRRIRAAFDAALASQEPNAGAAAVSLTLTGPGVFAVQSRQTIESEVSRLSIASVLVIVTLLLVVYRSFAALVLGLVPVASGALVAVAAVSLGFGVVHGITLGFGTTLIGEAVDYSIYLFVQSRQRGPGEAGQDAWIREFWPTILLGTLTSIVGFSSLLLSSFPGLAQLGLYSICGLVTAAAVTRFVLPRLLPRDFRIRDVSVMGSRLALAARGAPRLRWPLLALALAAGVLVFQQRDRLWNTELSSLSPVSEADQAADARLRADLGAPDVRYMVVVPGPGQQQALAGAERVAVHLDALVERGVLAGYESPSRYLPSIATQRARQAALPGADLEQRLREAAQGLPVKAGAFAPFLADVAAARTRAPLERADLEHTSLALAVDSLLFARAGRWSAVLPLTAAPGAESATADAVRAALAAAGREDAVFVDLKAESDHLYSGYLREALLAAFLGVGAIVLLLLLWLRAPLRVARVLLPLAAAVACVVALLALSGQRLTILHLIGLLLVVAVGSNYALFFSTPGKDMAPHTLTSLLFANLTTVAAFGVLGFSEVPVLQAIGRTVGPGAVLALLFAAAFSSRQPETRRTA